MADKVTLDFLAQKVDQLMMEVGTMRDDMRVMAAILQRLDNSHANLLTEVRGIHAQISRTDARLRKLESAAT